MLANLDNVKEMGYKSREFLEKGETNKFAELMHDHWLNKRKRSNNMTNDKIDEWYQIGLQNGAIGGKLVGAGGGGFLMFYAKDKQKLIHAMEVQGLHQVRFRFDFEGTKIISQ